MSGSIKKLSLLILSVLGLYPGIAAGQSNDAGVLCSEIQGESQRPNDPGCIDVLAWSWGQSVSVSFGGGGPPVPSLANFQDFNFSKTTDSSSEDLFGMLVTGTPLKGIVEYRQYRDCGVSCQATEPYLTIHFRNVLITSHSSAGSSGGSPFESVSLFFDEVSYCYRPTLKEGSLGTPQCFAFSRSTNSAIAPF